MRLFPALVALTLVCPACSGGTGQPLPGDDAGAAAAADGGFVGADGATPAVEASPSSDAPTSVGGSLRFDGLYQCDHDSYFSYLRFYADGVIVQASSTGTPEQVSVWLKQGATIGAQGTWGLVGSTIQFTTKVLTGGSVEYQGEVGDNQLALQVHSLIADSRYSELCDFVPVAQR